MWWLQQNTDEPTIEINIGELQKFIFQEVLFIEKMEKMINEALNAQNILSGKSLMLFSEWFGEHVKHFWETVFYFMPREEKIV